MAKISRSSWKFDALNAPIGQKDPLTIKKNVLSTFIKLRMWQEWALWGVEMTQRHMHGRTMHVEIAWAWRTEWVWEVVRNCINVVESGKDMVCGLVVCIIAIECLHIANIQALTKFSKSHIPVVGLVRIEVEFGWSLKRGPGKKSKKGEAALKWKVNYILTMCLSSLTEFLDLGVTCMSIN